MFALFITLVAKSHDPLKSPGLRVSTEAMTERVRQRPCLNAGTSVSQIFLQPCPNAKTYLIISTENHSNEPRTGRFLRGKYNLGDSSL